MKDLEKLIRRFTSLGKKSLVPSSYRVEPFSGIHALPVVSAFSLSNCITSLSNLIVLLC
jgi:hypothetical protein